MRVFLGNSFYSKCGASFHFLDNEKGGIHLRRWAGKTVAKTLKVYFKLANYKILLQKKVNKTILFVQSSNK